MVVSRRFEPPDLIAATLRGVIEARDQMEVVEWVRTSAKRIGPVRLLIVLESFGGWRPSDTFEDAAAWLDDGDGVLQIAVVGSREWKLAILTVIAQPLRSVPIRYFEGEAAARRWLTPTAPAPTAA